jgi:hypothetical protein
MMIGRRAPAGMKVAMPLEDVGDSLETVCPTEVRTGRPDLQPSSADHYGCDPIALMEQAVAPQLDDGEVGRSPRMQ